MGHSPAGLFGYSHLTGGYPGGQAEYLRVPHADVGCLKIESDLSDEKVLFLSDIFPTGYMAAENGNAETIDFTQNEVYDVLQDMTKGRVPDRGHVLRQAIFCCRKAGTISVPGVYIGFPDKIPMGALMNKGITLKTGQTHMQRYMKPLLEKVEDGSIDPSFVITHRLKLDQAPVMFRDVPRKERWLHQGRPAAVTQKLPSVHLEARETGTVRTRNVGIFLTTSVPSQA